MNDSILNSIKKLLGLTEEYKHFDQDIILHINTVFGILSQLGVGGSKTFYIEDETSKWGDFLGTADDLNMVKSYIYAKVRMIFDPPANSAISQALNATISELEWRLNVQVDPGNQNKE